MKSQIGYCKLRYRKDDSYIIMPNRLQQLDPLASDKV